MISQIYRFYFQSIAPLGAFFRRDQPVPDFLNEPIDLELVQIADRGTWGKGTTSPVEYFPQFANYPPAVAMRNGWVDNIRDYQNFTAFVFAYQHPDHPYSKFVRGLHPEITDEQIVSLVTKTTQ
jgi:hypothetical protein